MRYLSPKKKKKNRTIPISIRARLMTNRVTGINGFLHTTNTRKLVAWIKEVKPDLINLHNIHGDFVNVSVLLRGIASLGVPVVLTLHDCWTFTGNCPYFETTGCRCWKESCGRCPYLKQIEYPRSWFFDWTKRQFKTKKGLFRSLERLYLVSPSGWLLSLAGESTIHHGRPGRAIPNGIDFDSFYHPEYKRTACDKIRILGVASSWTKRKGLKYFLELAKDYGDLYEITLIGKFPKEIQDAHPAIYFVARTSTSEELIGHYEAADVFVNPTLEDNFPTCNLEALACGTPVVTFETGGSAECISEGVTGFIAKEKTAACLSAAIQSASRLVNRNQIYLSAHESLDSTIMVKRYDQYFREIVEGKA